MMPISPLFHPQELPKTSTSKFHVPFYFYFWQPTESNPKPICAQVLSQSLWGHSSKEMWPSLSQQPPRSTPNIFSARGWGLWTTPVSGKCWNEDWQSFTVTYSAELSWGQVCGSQLSSPSSGSRILSFPSPVLHPKPGMGWGWRNADADVSLKAKHTWPLGLNTDQLWVSIDERTHEKRPLRSRSRAAPI